jgi:hypothetical protein
MEGEKLAGGGIVHAPLTMAVTLEPSCSGLSASVLLSGGNQGTNGAAGWALHSHLPRASTRAAGLTALRSFVDSVNMMSGHSHIAADGWAATCAAGGAWHLYQRRGGGCDSGDFAITCARPQPMSGQQRPACSCRHARGSACPNQTRCLAPCPQTPMSCTHAPSPPPHLCCPPSLAPQTPLSSCSPRAHV